MAGNSQKSQQKPEGVKVARKAKDSVPPFLFCPYPSFDLDRYNDFEKMRQLERERIEKEEKAKAKKAVSPTLPNHCQADPTPLLQLFEQRKRKDSACSVGSEVSFVSL